MSRKMLHRLPILLLTLSLLPLSMSAQDTSTRGANRREALKQMQEAIQLAHSHGARANSKVKANDGGSPLQVLHGFNGGTDGDSPLGGVNLDSSGNLYGATPGGNTTGDYGTLYKIDAAGNYTVLYDFQNGSDGYGPIEAPLPPDASGNMYGTASSGGAGGLGTMFQFVPGTSTFNIEVGFGSSADATKGSIPGGLISDSAGNLYGFTENGGDFGYGNVFEAVSGNLSNPINLYSFTGNSDGAYPSSTGSLIMDTAGNLYGTTTNGGNSGLGNVYELSPPGVGACLTSNSYTNDSGWCESLLYSFDARTDPWIPSSGVAMDASGNLYGTGRVGGLNRAGGVWEITPVSSEPGGVCPAGSNQTAGSNWCETVLYSFQGPSAGDGANPEGSVVVDSKGNLYGAAYSGGANYCGALYSIGASGQYAQLYSFGCGNDGGYPYGTPSLSASGTTLYGTTSSSGVSGYGTVWSFAVVQPLSVTVAGASGGVVTSNPAGINCTTGTCTALFPTGTVVTLTEQSTQALTPFTGWSGACTGSENTCQVTVTGATSETATFTFGRGLVKPTLSFTGAPTSPTPYLQSFTVTAMTNASTLPAVTGNAACSSITAINSTTFNVTMTSGTGNCILKASWAGDTTYKAATATQTAAASLAYPYFTWSPLETAITYGTKLSTVELNATANSTSTGRITYENGSTAVRVGTLLEVGTYTLTANLAATRDCAASSFQQTLTVNPSATTTTMTAIALRTTPPTVKVNYTVTGTSARITDTASVVTVSDSTNTYTCQGTLLDDKGTCTITFTGVAAGTMETLTAAFAGDVNNTGSDSTATPVIVTLK